MKTLLFLIWWFASATVFAQQNLFNIPSGDITAKDEVFYQHQMNIYENNLMKSKQHFVYGIGHGYEVGFNILDVPISHFSGIDDSYRPLLAVSLQKGWLLNDQLSFNIGTQLGSVIRSRNSSESVTGFNYALFNYEFAHHKRVIIGAYHTLNETFLNGPGSSGVILGYEWFLNKRFGLMGDFISGRTKSSVSVLGVIYSITKNFQLCSGILIPNEQSLSASGIVLELNLFSFDAFN